MNDTITIDEVVRRTGLTSRALRFYEARGLIRPLRTHSGRRLFGQDELRRVHQITLLKKAGLSLAQMKQLFDRKPIDLATLLQGQLESLSEQAQEIERAQTTLKSALSRIENGEPLDVATLCSLIKDGDEIMLYDAKWKAVVDKYWPADAQAEWLERMQPVFQDRSNSYNDSYNRQWRDLSNRIEAALPLDPSGKIARAFLREWFALLEPFTRVATPQMWQHAGKMYDDMDNWPAGADAGFSKQVWDFIRAAQVRAMSEGYDFGPIPDWWGKSDNAKKSN